MKLIASAVLATLMAASAAQAAPVTLAPEVTTLGELSLDRQGISYEGSLVTALGVSDGTGQHILVLSKAEKVSPSKPNRNRLEYIALKARYLGRTAYGWQQEWVVQDFIDCPGLDSNGTFMTADVTVTDLNYDGQAEITVPYHLSCTGDGAPHTLKVIMREGDAKYAIRGESLVRFPGHAPMGGDRHLDASLSLPGKEAYRQHMLGVWNRVVSRVQAD